MYDVIVIGAGPTGCTAAKALSENGFRVLIVEKFKLPRYKSCSGMIIKKTTDLVKQYFGASIPSSTMCTPQENRGMIFTNDTGKEYRFEQSGFNVWRSAFDYWLATMAVEFGAELIDETAVISCEDQGSFVKVDLRGGKTCALETKYVLDCEGVVGAIKRKITQNSRDYITTFQTFNEGTIELDPHYFYAYLQPELSEYDAWFNVKDNLLVLGVSVKDQRKIGSYYDAFIRYMKAHHHLNILQQVKSEKWLMPTFTPDVPSIMGKDECFLPEK